MKLIKEVHFDTRMITETAKDGTKNLYIEGIFLQAGIKNRNGRVYPPEVMEREVNRYIKESVDKSRAMGELGHPETPAIGLDRVSHLITSLTKEGNDYVGKAKILNTPTGNIVRGLVEGGAVLGVSSRALGSLKEVNGVSVVQNDFLLSTAADVVSDPSAPGAWVQGVMENADWIYNASTDSWMFAEAVKGQIKKMSTKDLALKQAVLFEEFLRQIK